MTGRRRWLGSNSEETQTRVVAAVFLLGFLGAPFYRTDVVRAETLDGAVARPLTTVAVLCLSLALAWRALLRRDVVWCDPAWLTWADFDGSRPRLLAWRLTRGWAARFAAVGYATSTSAVLVGAPAAELVLAAAMFAAVAVLTLAATRRPPAPYGGFAEQLVPVLLTVLALAAIASPASVFGYPMLWGAAAVAALGASSVLLAPGQPITVASGRAELVRRFAERVVRRVSLTVLDVWALLPAAHRGAPVHALGGRPVLARFLAVGVLTRRGSLPTFALLALTAALLHAVLPGVHPVWWVAVGGFLAGLPFASGIAELFRHPGLRRWLGCSDRAVKLAALGVLVVVVAGWLGVAALFGVPLSVRAGLAILLAVAAVVRTVTRRAMDFANLGVVSIVGVLVPAGMLGQLLHGPDLLVLGAVLLTAGIAVSISGPIVVGLSAASALR